MTVLWHCPIHLQRPFLISHSPGLWLVCSLLQVVADGFWTTDSKYLAQNVVYKHLYLSDDSFVVIQVLASYDRTIFTFVLNSAWNLPMVAAGPKLGKRKRVEHGVSNPILYKTTLLKKSLTRKRQFKLITQRIWTFYLLVIALIKLLADWLVHFKLWLLIQWTMTI